MNYGWKINKNKHILPHNWVVTVVTVKIYMKKRKYNGNWIYDWNYV
jgi:hypothetical protein